MTDKFKAIIAEWSDETIKELMEGTVDISDIENGEGYEGDVAEMLNEIGGKGVLNLLNEMYGDKPEVGIMDQAGFKEYGLRIMSEALEALIESERVSLMKSIISESDDEDDDDDDDDDDEDEDEDEDEFDNNNTQKQSVKGDADPAL